MDNYETTSIPWRAHQPSFTQSTTDYIGESLTSIGDTASSSPNLVLLTRLVRIVGIRDLPEFTFNSDRKNVLGEGATYEVSETEVSSIQEVLGGPSTRRPAAVKIAKLNIGRTFADMGTNEAERRRLSVVLFELEVLSRRDIQEHRNIASLMGVSWGETAFGYAPCLVMELATMGTAREFTKKSRLSDSERLVICRDVACGLQFLHSVGIVHGDVKQDNVLIFADTNAVESFIAKLSDLERCPANSESLTYTGTMLYNAPEVRMRGGCSSIGVESLWLCDAFSFGLLCFEVFAGFSWKNIQESQENERSEQRVNNETFQLAYDTTKTLWKGSDALCRICQDIIKATLSDDPLKRLPFGWNMVLNILNYDDNMKMDTTFVEDRTLLMDHDASYSVLEIHTTVGGIHDDILGDAIWSDLKHTVSSTGNNEHRGHSAFNLFLLYSLGRYGKFESMRDALNDLEIAAKAQYGPAFVIGKRMFEANGLNDDIPEIFFEGPNDSNLRETIIELESLPNSLYYSSAIRSLWPPKLRRDAQKILSRLLNIAAMDLLPDDTSDLVSNIRKKRNEISNDTEFLALVEKSYLLHYSVANGDLAACELLLELRCDVNRMMPGGMTPLNLACRCVELEIMKLLLHCGADASLCDEKNISPLHWLVLLPNKHIRLVAELLSSQCKETKASFDSIRSRSPIFFDDLGLILDGTPLSWAIGCCNLAAVQSMVEFSKVEEKDAKGYLKDAIGNVCVDIVEYLLKSCKSLSVEAMEEIYIYLGRGVSTFTRCLIHGGSHDKALGDALDILGRSGVRVPLNSSDMVTTRLFTPLCTAVNSYDIPIIKELLNRGASVNDRCSGFHVLYWAFASSFGTGPKHKVTDTIMLLLERGAINESEPPIHLACSFTADVSIFRTLIERDSEARHAIFNNLTPLLALLLYHPSDNLFTKAQLLMDSPNVDLDFESSHTRREGDCCFTALAYALIGLEWEIAELLLKRNAKLELGTRGDHRQTVLHMLIRRASSIQADKKDTEWGLLLTVMDKLLQFQSSKGVVIVNTRDYQGNTPLRLAVTFALPSIVKKLLRRDYGMLDATVKEEHELLPGRISSVYSDMKKERMKSISELLGAHLLSSETRKKDK